MDEQFRSIDRVNGVDLSGWYDTGTVFASATFLTGTDDLVFVDSGSQMQIFSLVSQQCR
jgi:hypothetical protein